MRSNGGRAFLDESAHAFQPVGAADQGRKRLDAETSSAAKIHVSAEMDRHLALCKRLRAEAHQFACELEGSGLECLRRDNPGGKTRCISFGGVDMARQHDPFERLAATDMAGELLDAAGAGGGAELRF